MNDDLASPERLARWSEAFREYSRDTDPTSSLENLTRSWRELSGRAGMIVISVKNLQPGEFRINKLVHKGVVPSEDDTDTPLHGLKEPVQSGGILGRIVASKGAAVFRDLSLADDPVLGDRLARYTQILAFPIFEDGKITSWLLNLHTDEDDVSGREIEYRFIQSTMVGNVTNEKRALQELRLARKWIENEIDEIAAIQKKLLPAEMPDSKGISWAPFYETHDRTGGDYYDIFPLNGEDNESTRWGVLIADATGHGPSAAVVVAMLSTLRRTFPGTPGRPGEMLEYLNSQLMEGSIGYSLITAHLAFIDAEALTLSYACAGHPAPLLRYPDGTVTALEPDCNVPLGVDAATTYEDTDVTLEAGQTLLLYTDGITEARSPSGEMLEDERLTRAFAKTTGSADDRLTQLVQCLRDHEAGVRPTDDQTMLVIHLSE